MHRGKVSGIRPQLMVPLTPHHLTDKLHSSNQLVYIVAIIPNLPTKSIKVLTNLPNPLNHRNIGLLRQRVQGMPSSRPPVLGKNVSLVNLGLNRVRGFPSCLSSSSRTVLGAIFDIAKPFWSVLLTMIAESSANTYLTYCTGIISVRDFGRNRSLQFFHGECRPTPSMMIIRHGNPAL